MLPLKQLNKKCTVIACNYTPKWCPSEGGKGNLKKPCNLARIWDKLLHPTSCSEQLAPSRSPL